MDIRFSARLLVLLALAAGCASSGPSPESRKAVASLGEVRDQLARVSALIGQTQSNLARLATHEDLRGSFEELGDSLEALERESERAAQRSVDMTERAHEYLAAWERSADRVGNQDVRTCAAERRQAVWASFQRIADASRKARDDYAPYLRDLRDVHTALENDLTRSGVEGLGPTFARIEGEARRLMRRLDEVIAETDAVHGGLAID